MDTTAKMSRTTKHQLERLRSEVARRTGRRVTQREILAHLVRRASRDVASEAGYFDDEGRSMGPQEFHRFLRRRRGGGVADLSQDIDHHLYGGRP